jgi:hypothetical protein
MKTFNRLSLLVDTTGLGSISGINDNKARVEAGDGDASITFWCRVEDVPKVGDVLHVTIETEQ